MDFGKQLKDDLLKGSTAAVCGIMEREKNVKVENLAEFKRKLKAQGYIIVGTSEKGGKTRKVWFSPSVSL